MTRRIVLLGAAAAFLLLLLYLTFSSTSTPLEHSAADRQRAQEVCRESVRGELPDARFPFDGTFGEVGEVGIRLSGSVDAGPEEQLIRRNYECYLGSDSDGVYVVDSVVVWQSH